MLSTQAPPTTNAKPATDPTHPMPTSPTKPTPKAQRTKHRGRGQRFKDLCTTSAEAHGHTIYKEGIRVLKAAVLKALTDSKRGAVFVSPTLHKESLSLCLREFFSRVLPHQVTKKVISTALAKRPLQLGRLAEDTPHTRAATEPANRMPPSEPASQTQPLMHPRQLPLARTDRSPRATLKNETQCTLEPAVKATAKSQLPLRAPLDVWRPAPAVAEEEPLFRIPLVLEPDEVFLVKRIVAVFVYDGFSYVELEWLPTAVPLAAIPLALHAVVPARATSDVLESHRVGGGEFYDVEQVLEINHTPSGSYAIIQWKNTFEPDTNVDNEDLIAFFREHYNMEVQSRR